MDFVTGFHTVMDCGGLGLILEQRVLGFVVFLVIDE